MGKLNRSINIAKIKETGEVIIADECFKEAKEGFRYRKLFHEKEISFKCLECGQDLNISRSSLDRVYLRHKANHESCFLSDNELEDYQLEEYERAVAAKESDRHKELKWKIGNRLMPVPGVESGSVAVDNKFIVKEDGRRKPDVYCRFKGKELVFEIQLSELSLAYILSRHNFYRKHGIYLIWILDTYDVKKQGTKEKDLKYLSSHQNFFKLDESVQEFRLICDYKFSFLTDDNELLSKWLDKSISLHQLKFEEISWQAYYFDFSRQLAELEEQQKIKKAEARLEREKKLLEQRENNTKAKISGIVQQIKRLKQARAIDFSEVTNEIEDLDPHELKALNVYLGFNNPEKYRVPALFSWVDEVASIGPFFLIFILRCAEIELDVQGSASSGESLFAKVISTLNTYRDTVVKLLFKRGYNLTEADREIYKAKMGIQGSDGLMSYEFCNRLTNRLLVDDVSKHFKLLLIFESIRIGKVTGFNFGEGNWVAFANNAIEYYPKYWARIESALKQSGLWETLHQKDKKKTFLKKLESWEASSPVQAEDAFDVVFDLFPHFCFG